MNRISGLLPARGTNVVLVVGAALAGFWLPAVPFVSHVVLPAVAFLIYVSLRDVRAGRLRRAVRPHHVVVGLAVSYLVLPVGSFLLGRVVADGTVRTGLFVVAAIPITAGSSIVWTNLSNGDAELASVVAVSSILLAPAVTPLIVSVLAGTTVPLSVLPIVTNLVAIVAGGLLLRIVVPRGAIRDSRIERASQAAITLLVYASVAQLEFGPTASELPLFVVVSSTAALLLFGLAASLVVSRTLGLPRPVRSALFFSGGLKNLGVGLVLVDLLSIPSTTVVVVTYYLVQQVVGAATADLFFGGDTRTEPT